MAQLMPLPLTVSCFSKIQIGFTFLVPAHLGSPGQRAVKRVCVCLIYNRLNENFFFYEFSRLNGCVPIHNDRRNRRCYSSIRKMALISARTPHYQSNTASSIASQHGPRHPPLSAGAFTSSELITRAARSSLPSPHSARSVKSYTIKRNNSWWSAIFFTARRQEKRDACYDRVSANPRVLSRKLAF